MFENKICWKLNNNDQEMLKRVVCDLDGRLTLMGGDYHFENITVWSDGTYCHTAEQEFSNSLFADKTLFYTDENMFLNDIKTYFKI